MDTSRLRNSLLALLSLSLGLLQQQCLADVDTSLVAPHGFYVSIASHSERRTACEQAPQPFTKPLDFPSKYEGSDAARDNLNVDAELRYKEATSTISTFEIGVAAMASRYAQSRSVEVANCALSWLTSWAEHGALLAKAETHTGKSVRKWVLAAVSTSYLRLQRSNSPQPDERSNKQATIEAWLRSIAAKVMEEWPVDAPINKVNNHFYWAAWSLISTGTVLNDRAMFNHGMKIFRTFERQVSDKGLLSNEVSRRSRALGYHAYALAPLTMIATFGIANGEVVDTTPSSPLSRLARTVFDGFHAPTRFADSVGSKQKFSSNVNTNFSWLEPYCSIVACDRDMMEFLQQNRPFKSTRMGGDLTTLFGSK